MIAPRDHVLTEVPERVLLAGFGAANQAAARALVARGHAVVAFDDAPRASTTAIAAGLGLDLHDAPDASQLNELLRGTDVLLPTPGLPHGHPVLQAAETLGVCCAGEFDLARIWDDRPIAAVTGTSGKTTVTEMVVAALQASGVSAVAAGNNDTPLVAAIDQGDVEVFVVEASSFRLAHSQLFEPAAACWLNFAADHLDVHPDLGNYEDAKARIWHDLSPTSMAVANADDPVVMSRVRYDRPLWTFSAKPRRATHWHVSGTTLAGPPGPFMEISELKRARPHDLANALAAAATASAMGATTDGLRHAFARFEPGAHRLQLVASIGEVDFIDDSKATTPHAAIAALNSFDKSVLIAGGQNKGIDLATLRGAEAHVHAVVAIGEAAGEVSAVFEGRRPVKRATGMRHAVELAAGLAEPGMTVLLSPACASFDAYRSYAERGDHFARIVSEAALRTRPCAQRPQRDSTKCSSRDPEVHATRQVRT